MSATVYTCALVTILSVVAITTSPTAADGSVPRDSFVLDADFTTATIAFYDRTRRYDPRIKIDDRPCDADGAPWPIAEAALVTAFIRDRARAEDLNAWRSLRERRNIAFAHAPSTSLHESRLEIVDRRGRGNRHVDIGVNLTTHGGYLVVVAPEGVREYCVAISSRGSSVEMLPRLVNMSEY